VNVCDECAEDEDGEEVLHRCVEGRLSERIRMSRVFVYVRVG